MTQTNNEREALIQLLNATATRHGQYDDKAISEARKIATNALEQSSISQNEQPKQIPDGWVADPDTIPSQLIEITRQAICLEFGDSGTDGYYKRILAKIFKAMINTAPTTSLTSETNTEVGE